MQELSLHILDLVQNSTNADASRITIDILEDVRKNLLQIIIADNGHGIKKERLPTITSPFSTTRTTRRVGLGLSLLKAAAEQCNGTLRIQSEEQQGTTVTITFEHQHIDRVPLGDIAATLITLIVGNPAIDFSYQHQVNDARFEFSTAAVKQELGEVSISEISVVSFLSDYLQTNIDNLYREAGIV